MTLRFRTNFDDWVTAGPDHAITVTESPDTGAPTPYIRTRDGLDARIARPVYYELAALAVPVRRAGRQAFGVWSDGMFFELGESA